MTGAQEQAGLREPGDWAAQVSTIDGENQELRQPLLVHAQVANVDPCQRGHAVPRLAERVIEGFQQSFVDRELVHFVQGNPVNLSFGQFPMK